MRLIIDALLFIWKLIKSLFTTNKSNSLFPKRKKIALQEKSNFSYRQPKPEWVCKEVIRLKAYLPSYGCRKIANTFNRLHLDKSGESVSKSYCAATIKKHLYEIKVLRSNMRSRKPRRLPRNLIWATDLTTVTDQENKQHKIISFIDHGSRACLSLEHIHTKGSIVLLRHLLNCIELYGRPKYLRTDNEAVFCSKLFTLCLHILNIKHQRTELCCPWQNGRVERFFGTFKSKIKQVVIGSGEQLTNSLPVYRFWYNHVKTHENLQGKTPAEVWDKRSFNYRKKPLYFNEWDGVLHGYYLRS